MLNSPLAITVVGGEAAEIPFLCLMILEWLVCMRALPWEEVEGRRACPCLVLLPVFLLLLCLCGRAANSQMMNSMQEM